MSMYSCRCCSCHYIKSCHFIQAGVIIYNYVIVFKQVPASTIMLLYSSRCRSCHYIQLCHCIEASASIYNYVFRQVSSYTIMLLYSSRCHDIQPVPNAWPKSGVSHWQLHQGLSICVEQQGKLTFPFFITPLLLSTSASGGWIWILLPSLMGWLLYHWATHWPIWLWLIMNSIKTR
jgi:hypothetical protein